MYILVFDDFNYFGIFTDPFCFHQVLVHLAANLLFFLG